MSWFSGQSINILWLYFKHKGLLNHLHTMLQFHLDNQLLPHKILSYWHKYLDNIDSHKLSAYCQPDNKFQMGKHPHMFETDRLNKEDLGNLYWLLLIPATHVWVVRSANSDGFDEQSSTHFCLLVSLYVTIGDVGQAILWYYLLVTHVLVESSANVGLTQSMVIILFTLYTSICNTVKVCDMRWIPWTFVITIPSERIWCWGRTWRWYHLN